MGGERKEKAESSPGWVREAGIPLRESKGEQYHLALSLRVSLPGDFHQGSAPERRNNFLCHSAMELSLGASTPWCCTADKKQ